MLYYVRLDYVPLYNWAGEWEAFQPSIMTFFLQINPNYCKAAHNNSQQRITLTFFISANPANEGSIVALWRFG